MLFEAFELVVAEPVHDLIDDSVFVIVNIDDNEGDDDTVLHNVDDIVVFGEAETVFDPNGFAETVLDADTVLDTVCVFDIKLEEVSDGVIKGVPVFFIEPVPVIETVDVLLFDWDFVVVVVIVELLDGIIVLVSDFDGITVTEYVGVVVVVLELAIDREPLVDAVPVLDDVVVDVDVCDIRVDNVGRVVIDIEGECDDVLEGADERELVLLNDDVRDDLRERVPVGLALVVFELDTLPVCVFEIGGETDVLYDAEFVFDINPVTDGCVDDEDVFDIVPDFVEVIVDVVVFVDVEETLISDVGNDVFVPVVVLVDVLLAVVV